VESTEKKPNRINERNRSRAEVGLQFAAFAVCILRPFITPNHPALISRMLLHRQYLYNGWPRIFVKTTQTIGPGEEVLADYGDDYWTHFAGIALEHDQVCWSACYRRLALLH